MNKTKIEWCDSTWNPITGCYHKCPYCYARRIANRFSGHREDLSENEIRVLDNKIYAEESKKAEAYPYGFVPTLHRYRLNEYENKKGRTIFVCSMADLFGSWVPDEWIEEVFAACERAPQHTYLFITKNPERYLTLALAGKLPAKDNMWYGTTATTPDKNFFWGGAWHTFVSIEPILRDYSSEIGKMCDTFAQWVIIGAETGNRKDKVVPEKSWLDEIVKTCIESNITVFMKDSLVPIVGEENMFRELPWDRTTWESEKGQEWLDRYYQAIDLRDTNLS